MYNTCITDSANKNLIRFPRWDGVSVFEFETDTLLGDIVGSGMTTYRSERSCE